MSGNFNMKYSTGWLNEISGLKITAEKMAELLTAHSFEIEGDKKPSEKLDKIVVGKILEIKKHSNADKLQLVRVDVGKEKLNIVCGAWNIKVGDKVPVALVGAKLPNGMEISTAEIRGEKSNGMLCAQDELGLGKDHSGIMIFHKNARVGKAIQEYLGSTEEVMEIKMLSNRSHDALSYVGVAREIAALSGKKMDYDFDGLKLPKIRSKKLSVKIQDKKLCPRYIGAVLENVEIKESPDWIKSRLIASGVRPINNVVDTTNYVMLELGQPLHAFDFNKLAKSERMNNELERMEIIVRRSKKDEKMILLDGSEIKLSENNLLITNGEEALALAGVMGGKNSGISKNTKTIVIEAANFNAVSVRKTRTEHNMKTEASDRFEKDIDPNLAEKATVRAIEILERIAGAKSEGIADIYPKPVKPWKVKLDLDYANNLLGEEIPAKEIIKILNALSINTTIQPYKVVKNKKTFLNCIVPTFRIDLRTQEDLIEEIGRIWGYEKIKPQPIIGPAVSAPVNSQLQFERKIREKMAGLGFDEMYNYSFYSEEDADRCGLSSVSHFALENPMNPEQKYVRASLIPGILKNIRENLKNFESLKIFEAGRTYQPSDNKAEEKRMLVVAETFLAVKPLKSGLGVSGDAFLKMKGVAEDLLDSFGIKDIKFNHLDIQCPSVAHPGRAAEIKISGKIIGVIYEVNPAVLAQYKIEKRTAIAEIDLEKMLTALPKEIIYQPIRKFPTVIRDISMMTGADNTVAKISDFIRKIGGSLIINVEIFDVFQKDGKASLAFHIELGADRTLASEEIDVVMGKITSGLEKELGVEIRK